MIRITDEAEAFAVLEELSAVDFDFTQQHAKFLRSPKRMVFFLFCPAGTAKGAHVFLFDNPPVAGEIENDLLSAVMQFGGDAHADELRERGSEAIREFLETKSAGHYFFDAH